MAFPAQEPEYRDKSLGDLLRDLSEETSRLVRQEIELARAELTEKARGYGLAVGLLAGAGVAAFIFLGTLTATVILALSLVFQGWLSALIVSVVWLLIGAGLAYYGRNKLREAAPPVPEQTIETIKEDVQWAKNRTRSAGR